MRTAEFVARSYLVVMAVGYMMLCSALISLALR
jgi:hypothetical protein